MAKTDNLSDFLTDVANSIRTRTGTTEQINAQDFSDKILSMSGGGETTVKNLLDATKSCYYLFYNYGGTSVDNLIQPNDTKNVTTMKNMFLDCNKLTTIPQLDTSNVTNMENMFRSCANLTTIPLLDTSKVTNMSYMFYGCNKLTPIPQLDTSNVTNMDTMFSLCTSLTVIPQLDTSKVTDMHQLFSHCNKLTTIPQLNTSNVTNMSGMFRNCNNLTTVPALDVSRVTNMYGMFEGCTNLKSILMTNIGEDLDISASALFEKADLLVILNNLKTVTSRTLTMGSNNLAKLTDEDKAIATNKG